MTKKLAIATTLTTPRRGYVISQLDAIVNALWKDIATNVWPEKSFGEICSDASKTVGRQLLSASIRGAVYQHMDLFERVESKNDQVKWRLSRKARALK